MQIVCLRTPRESLYFLPKGTAARTNRRHMFVRGMAWGFIPEWVHRAFLQQSRIVAAAERNSWIMQEHQNNRHQAPVECYRSCCCTTREGHREAPNWRGEFCDRIPPCRPPPIDRKPGWPESSPTYICFVFVGGMPSLNHFNARYGTLYFLRPLREELYRQKTKNLIELKLNPAEKKHEHQVCQNHILQNKNIRLCWVYEPRGSEA